MQWTGMDYGYPKVETQGSRTLITFRFNFNDYKDFFYSPSITFGAGNAAALSYLLLFLCSIVNVVLF